MDNTNTSTDRTSAGAPSAGGNDRREPAAGTIRYAGAKEARVPLPVVLIVFVVFAAVVFAVRHHVQF